MKLSKKNQTRQRVISRMLASGKALGGLLAGVAATVLAGCRDNSPNSRMGSYPNPAVRSNAASESHSRSGRMGKYLVKEPETEQEEKPAKPNKAEEAGH